MEAMLCDWMSHFSFLEYLCMTRQRNVTESNEWAALLNIPAVYCVKAMFVAIICKISLIVFCFVENIFAWILFCDKHVCFNSSSESAQIISPIQHFLQIFHFVDIKFVKSAPKKKINNLWWKNIIWLIIAIFLLWIFS